jgi:intermediate cleaving peptidase 55
MQKKKCGMGHGIQDMFTNSRSMLRPTSTRTSIEDAASIFRADDVRHISFFSSHLKSLLPSFSHVFVDEPDTQRYSRLPRRSSAAIAKSILKHLSSSSEPDASGCEYILSTISGSKRKPLAPEIARLRVIKSPAEQKVMRAAGDISGRALAKV